VVGAAAAENDPHAANVATLRALGDDRLCQVVESYVVAGEARDVDALVALVALLVDGATFATPPHPTWWHGRDAIIGFIGRSGTPALRHVMTHANGKPAVVWCLWSGERNAYLPRLSRCSASTART
jgi:RNA polymerase sigma-70 factor, ECF subfamily